MEDDYLQYELLARHLGPQFGNVYQYNLEPGQIVGYNIQDWTDEIREAIRQYLLNDLPAEVFDCLYDLGEDGPLDPATKETRINTLIERLEPWEVALSVRNAAVAAVPTLRQLIGQLDDWPSEDERGDAETWLETHGETVDWRRLMAATGHYELTSITTPTGGNRQPYPDDLVHALTPAELLDAWESENGPAPTDLTDTEWELLAPALPQRPVANALPGTVRPLNERELAIKRRFFNAIRFKTAHRGPWSLLPLGYGSWQSTYQIYYRYQAEGVFVRLREALKDNPEAAELVAWLNQVIAGDLGTSAKAHDRP